MAEVKAEQREKSGISFSALSDWGIELTYLLGALIGSLVFVLKKENRKRPKWEKAVIILTGICVGNYLTPLIIWSVLIIWEVTVPVNVHGGISFALGYMGLETVGIIIDVAREAKKTGSPFKKYKK